MARCPTPTLTIRLAADGTPGGGAVETRALYSRPVRAGTRSDAIRATSRGPMTEILTELFCERCGTRYTFESARPRTRLKGVKVLSRGLKNFVLSDDTSIDEAMAAARSETDRERPPTSSTPSTRRSTSACRAASTPARTAGTKPRRAACRAPRTSATRSAGTVPRPRDELVPDRGSGRRGRRERVERATEPRSARRTLRFRRASQALRAPPRSTSRRPTPSRPRLSPSRRRRGRGDRRVVPDVIEERRCGRSAVRDRGSPVDAGMAGAAGGRGAVRRGAPSRRAGATERRRRDRSPDGSTCRAACRRSETPDAAPDASSGRGGQGRRVPPEPGLLQRFRPGQSLDAELRRIRARNEPTSRPRRGCRAVAAEADESPTETSPSRRRRRARGRRRARAVAAEPPPVAAAEAPRQSGRRAEARRRGGRGWPQPRAARARLAAEPRSAARRRARRGCRSRSRPPSLTARPKSPLRRTRPTSSSNPPGGSSRPTRRTTRAHRRPAGDPAPSRAASRGDRRARRRAAVAGPTRMAGRRIGCRRPPVPGRPPTPQGGIDALWAARTRKLVTAPPTPGQAVRQRDPAVHQLRAVTLRHCPVLPALRDAPGR